ncbi:MAP kinase kinase kinase SSK2 [Gracilariopsis chorda]|uniref:MAP kinase kinase kinase SSK2 n=1 Tax=Gracilariopsis chorda TaxID=448386 RepID=A0A2V3INZ0_9FLOR|nr:MAP kinase kinase kinase SSK2 [Gracilariopsis chorda]|eukprot:PXF43769.1 MAP kinase kinase kinase SSK2 [Gracilariopsis chorda]
MLQLDASRVAVSLDDQYGTPIVLGRGSFGVVYAGVLDSVYPVALKQVRLPCVQRAHSLCDADSDEQLARGNSRSAQLRRVAQRQFAREVRRYRALRSVRSVATYYGFCKPADGAPLLAVERLACSLAEVLELDLSERDALTLAISLADAVADVHRGSFSHGDLKPSNVLLTEAPCESGLANGTRVKLVDFGLSRAFDAEDGADDDDGGQQWVHGAPSARSAPEMSRDCDSVSSEHPDDNQRALRLLGEVEARGTPAYLSPEAWGGSGALSSREAAQRADVFALGVMLHELDGGTRPWRHLHQWGIFVAVVQNEERPAAPPKARVRGLADITNAAWAQRACERPTAAALAARLRKLRAALSKSAQNEKPPLQTLSPTRVRPNSPPNSPPRWLAFDMPAPSVSPLSQPTSSGYAPDADRDSGASDQSPSSPPHSLQYAFKQQVLADDIGSLCEALVLHEREPAVATAALEAMAVLLDQHNLPNCRFVSQRSSLLAVAGILSRYGRSHPRLCKSACVLVLRLADAKDPPVEKDLRSSGACEIVLNCLRWHPAALPVLLNAACALAKLAAASPQLAAIVAELGGASAALRVLSRSFTSFDADVPVAEAAFDVLHALVGAHAQTLIDANVVAAVAECCDNFESPTIDARCVRLLYALVRTPAGKNKAVTTRGCLDAISRLIDRCVQADEPCGTTLIIAFHVVSEMAKSERMADATSVFMSSSIVPSVMESKDAIIEICKQGNLTLINAAFECIRNMSTLGTDVCGSLQMSHVFEFTSDLVQVSITDSTVALRAVLFLKSILHELRNSSYAANVDHISRILSQMQERWKSQPAIAPHVRDAVRVLEETTARQKRRNRQQSGTEQSAEEEPEQKTSFSAGLFFRWRHSKPRSTRA